MTDPSSPNRVETVLPRHGLRLLNFVAHARKEVDRIDADYERVRNGLRDHSRPTADSLHHLLNIERQREVALARYHAGLQIAEFIGVTPTTPEED